MRFSIRKAVALVLAGGFFSLSLAFQNPKDKDKERPQKEEPSLRSPGPSSQRRPQFRAEVDQVVIHAAVYDKNSQLLSGLLKEDFAVFEDKVEQQITYFGQEDIPSTIGIVMDSSGSMRNKMELVNEATQLFLEMSHPENELFLIDFDDKVLLEEDFTRDVEDIRDALDNLIVSGGTALYDALFLAAEKGQQGEEPKKALVVFTDGEDKDSYYRYEELLEKIRETDVQVHIVAFLDPELSQDRGFFGVFKSDREKVKQKLETLADYSGGKVFFPEEVDQLRGVFQDIAQDLRKQYRLAYVSSNPAKDGAWRNIDVVVKGAKEKGWKVRAKKGYYARPQAAAGGLP